MGWLINLDIQVSLCQENIDVLCSFITTNKRPRLEYALSLDNNSFMTVYRDSEDISVIPRKVECPKSG